MVASEISMMYIRTYEGTFSRFTGKTIQFLNGQLNSVTLNINGPYANS